MAIQAIGTNAVPGNTYADPGIYYDKRFLLRLTPQLYFKQCGEARPLPQRSGTLIKWHRLNKLAASTTPLGEGANPAEQNVATSVVSAEPLTYGAYVKVSAELNLKSINPIVEEILDELSDQAALSYDTLVFNAIHTNFINQYANGAANEAAVADGDVLNATELRKAVYRLRKAKVPGFEGNLYKGVIDPAGHFDLQSDTAAGGWIDVMKYSKPEEIMKGEVGQLYGVRLVVSNNIPTGTGATDETFRAFILGKQAYGVTELSGQGVKTIRQPAGGNADPLEMFTTLGWKFMMAAKVLEAARGVEIYHGSAAE
jgi:N4-gp56 family major capsid protein